MFDKQNIQKSNTINVGQLDRMNTQSEERFDEPMKVLSKYEKQIQMQKPAARHPTGIAKCTSHYGATGAA